MKILHPGHIYELDHVDGNGKTIVPFVNKEPGFECEGTTTQEICRMLIDRTRYCNNCLPHRVNEEIVYHFRKIIALHEARAIERATDKGELAPELVEIAPNGHWLLLGYRKGLENETICLNPATQPSNPMQKPKYGESK